MDKTIGSPQGLPKAQSTVTVKTQLNGLQEVVEAALGFEGSNDFTDYYVVAPEIIAVLADLLSCSRPPSYTNSNGNQVGIPDNVMSLLSTVLSLPQMHPKQVEMKRADNLKNSEKNLPINNFKSTDKGPFFVLVQSRSSTDGIGTLRDMRLGRLMIKHNIIGVKDIQRRGRNRIAVYFNDYKNANNLLISPMLEKENLSAFIPTHVVSCQGIVFDVDEDLSEEELIQNYKSKVKIISIRRRNKRTDKKDAENRFIYTASSVVLVTFEGKILPEYIQFYNSARTVQQFIHPVIQCFNCLEYGHTSSLCKSKIKRCFKCASEHAPEDCNASVIRCFQCGSTSHTGTEKGTRAQARVCPEFLRQQKIKESMAFSNLSFYEASKLIPRSHNKIGFKPQEHSRRAKDFPNALKITINPNINIKHKSGYNTVTKGKRLLSSESSADSPPTNANRASNKKLALNLNQKQHANIIRPTKKSSSQGVVSPPIYETDSYRKHQQSSTPNDTPLCLYFKNSASDSDMRSGLNIIKDYDPALYERIVKTPCTPINDITLFDSCSETEH